jgi:hypothetical protein
VVWIGAPTIYHLVQHAPTTPVRLCVGCVWAVCGPLQATQWGWTWVSMAPANGFNLVMVPKDGGEEYVDAPSPSALSPLLSHRKAAWRPR